MLTVTVVIVLAAFVIACMAGAGKAPLWCSVVLLCILELLRVLPR